MSKIKELREKNPEFIIDMVKLLSERDPSGTNKYLKFMIDTSRPFVESYFNTGQFLDVSFVQLTILVKKFEQYVSDNLLTEKDIYAYPNVEAIEAAIKEADVIAELRNVKTTETLVLYEDANCILVKPLSQRSSATYGKNTKWCTSENGGGSFNSYASEGCLIYFMWKHPPADLPEEWRKVAFNRRSLSEESRIWNAPDKQISGGDAWRLGAIIGQTVMGIIAQEFDLCIPNTSLRKDTSGKIMIEKSLFEKDGFKKRRKEIEAYVATLKGNREKKLSKPDTFEHTPEERKIIEDATGGDILEGEVEDRVEEQAEAPQEERPDRPPMGRGGQGAGLIQNLYSAVPDMRKEVYEGEEIDVTEALHEKLMSELKSKEADNRHLVGYGGGKTVSNEANLNRFEGVKQEKRTLDDLAAEIGAHKDVMNKFAANLPQVQASNDVYVGLEKTRSDYANVVGAGTMTAKEATLWSKFTDVLGMTKAAPDNAIGDEVEG